MIILLIILLIVAGTTVVILAFVFLDKIISLLKSLFCKNSGAPPSEDGTDKKKKINIFFIIIKHILDK